MANGVVSEVQERTGTRNYRPVLFSFSGMVYRARVSPVTGGRYVHNLTIIGESSRKYFHCTVWGDEPLDLDSLVDTEVTFGVTGIEEGRRTDDGNQFGTDFGTRCPRLIFIGVLL